MLKPYQGYNGTSSYPENSAIALKTHHNQEFIHIELRDQNIPGKLDQCNCWLECTGVLVSN